MKMSCTELSVNNVKIKNGIKKHNVRDGGADIKLDSSGTPKGVTKNVLKVSKKKSITTL